MFSFMKKDKDKDKEKKEKVDKKKKDKDEKVEKKERQNMTPEEISRIEEMKKMQRKFSDKDKKRSSQRSSHLPSPTDSEDKKRSSQRLSSHQPSPTESEESASSSHSSPVKESRPLTKPQPLPRLQQPAPPATVRREAPPAVMPKPKVKSILKGKGDGVQSLPPTVNLDDSKLLQENTKCNEDLFIKETNVQTSAAPKVQDTASALTTPSMPNGDCKNFEEENCKPKPFESKLKLPVIVPPKAPRVREIEVHRMASGGFGFSLRKGLIPEHGGGAPRVVTFAEPGNAACSIQTGLLPGDKLVEVSLCCFLCVRQL
jgi:hypothetical protein